MIRLYDTARREIVPFAPGPVVRMYVCGITPYDSTHLGHAATYLTYDILIRRLEELGHEVRMVRNVTDVDDSILPKARELGVPYLELAEAELARFHSDMEALGMRPPIAEPRATETIDEIVSIVERLLDSGHAYLTHGTAYFDTSTFAGFGKLSQYSRDQMVRLARARGGNPDDPHRRDPLDFVLWQPSLADEPAWRAPFGVGRPGWHIECSAMSMQELGPTLDLHGGGTDLIFPHHECEVAQSEALTGRAVRAPLAALGDGGVRGREDEQVARQPRVRERPVEGRRPARDPPRVDAPPLPLRLRVARHRHPGRHRAAAPARGRRAARHRARPDRASRARCGPRSTTTSTRRRRSRRSPSWPTRSSPAARTRPRPTRCASLSKLLGIDLTFP